MTRVRLALAAASVVLTAVVCSAQTVSPAPAPPGFPPAPGLMGGSVYATAGGYSAGTYPGGVVVFGPGGPDAVPGPLPWCTAVTADGTAAYRLGGRGYVRAFGGPAAELAGVPGGSAFPKAVSPDGRVCGGELSGPAVGRVACVWGPDLAPVPLAAVADFSGWDRVVSVHFVALDPESGTYSAWGYGVFGGVLAGFVVGGLEF